MTNKADFKNHTNQVNTKTVSSDFLFDALALETAKYSENLSRRSEGALVHSHAQMHTQAQAHAQLDARAKILNVNYQLKKYLYLDVFALLCGFAVAWLIAAIGYLYFNVRTSFEMSDYSVRLYQFSVISFGLIFWFAHSGHYRVRLAFWSETQKIVSGTFFAFLMDGFLQFASKQDFSRLSLGICWVFAGICLLCFRNLFRARLRRLNLWSVSTLLVGGGTTSAKAQEALAQADDLGFKIVKTIAKLSEEYIGAGRSWQNLCHKHKADYIVIALDGADFDKAAPILAQLSRENIGFSIIMPFHNLPVVGLLPQTFINSDFQFLTRVSGLELPLPRFIKRAFDVLAAIGGLLFLSPLLISLALLVKLDGGPALFGHTRMGLNGKKFKCLKFRSMVLNGDEVLQKYLQHNPDAKTEWQAERKLKSDPRVTALGSFLRKTSLDELPQLINVIKGEMSIVGPRPIVADEAELYAKDFAHYSRVRPGITGLWQVSGRNDVSYAERIRMDSWYVRNWSLWHDIVIILKTFPALLAKRGAY